MHNNKIPLSVNINLLQKLSKYLHNCKMKISFSVYKGLLFKYKEVFDIELNSYKRRVIVSHEQPSRSVT